MKSIKIFTLVFLISCVITSYAQPGGLKVNDPLYPISLPSYDHKVDKFSFPYDQKLVYMRFWSVDSVSSKKDLNKIKRLYKRNSEEKYYNITGFDVILISLDKDRSKWEQEIVENNLESMKNYIATKGINDYYIKQYKLSKVPYSILVNEEGQVKSINPTIAMVEEALEEYKVEKTKGVNEIAGKILQGEDIDKKGLSNQTVYITNNKNDTVQKVVTNQNGAFIVKNIENQSSLTFNIGKSDYLKGNQKLRIENTSGELIDDFSVTKNGYAATITKGDMIDMKETKGIKELYFSENLFKLRENVLSEYAKGKLDTMSIVMHNDLKLKVEIFSHTDCKGENEANLKLSQLRADLCSNYLIQKGIDKGRILATGYGETQPINECIDGVKCSDEETEKNRRIEFIFTQGK